MIDHRHTVHAQQAFELSDLFAYKFDPIVFGKPHARRLQLREPDGPSTAGGRQARQSIVLVADHDQETLVCGWLDVARKRSELKSWSSLSAQYQQRFQRALNLEQHEYERALRELETFLRIQKIDTYVTITPIAHPSPPEAPKSERPEVPEESLTVLLGMLGLGIIIGFALGYLVFGG